MSRWKLEFTKVIVVDDAETELEALEKGADLITAIVKRDGFFATYGTYQVLEGPEK